MATAAKKADARAEDRHEATCRASARLAFSITLRNASRSGMQARTSVPLPQGATLRVVLPGAVECHATVMWADGDTVGCRFLRPLTDVQLATVLATVPPAEMGVFG